MPKLYGYTEILGDVLITGSFSILGSASTINSTNLTVDDSIIVLAHGQTGSPVLDTGIFFVRGTGATQAFIWDESVDEFALVQTSDDHTVIGNINITGYSNLRLGNIGIGGAPSVNTTAYIKGSDSSSGTYSLKIDDVNSNPILYVRNDKQIYISGNVAQNSGGSVDIGYYQIIPSGYSYGMLVSGSPLYGNYAATGNTSRTHFYSSESQKTAYEADMAASVSSAYRIGFGASIVGVNSTGYNIAFNANVINGTSGNYTIYSTNGDSFFNNTSMRLQGRTNGTDSILSLWNLIGDSILYVRNDGNVGIGTTSPTSKLHIKGSGTSSGTYSLKIDDASNNNLFSILDNGQVNFNTTVDTWGTYNFTSTGGNVIYITSLSSGSYAGILFNTEGSARLHIDTNATGARIRSQGTTNMYLARGVAEQELLSFGPNYIQMEAPVGVGIGKYGPSVSARLHIQGSDSSSGTYSLIIQNSSSTNLLSVRNDGFISINGSSFNGKLEVTGGSNQGVIAYSSNIAINGVASGAGAIGVVAQNQSGAGTSLFIRSYDASNVLINIVNSTTNNISRMLDSGYFGIGTITPTAMTHIKGSGTSSGTYSLKIDDGGGNPLLSVRNDGYISAGDNTQLYNTFLDYYNGTLKVNYNTASSFYWNGSELYLNGLNGGTTGGSYLRFTAIPARNYYLLTANASGRLGFSSTGGYADMQLSSNGNLFIGTDVSGFDATARLHIKGIDNTSSNYGLKIESASASSILSVRNDGRVFIGKSIIANAPMEVGFGQDPYSTGYNTALGVNSLNSWNGAYSAGANIAVGYETLKNLTTGQYNVAVGYQALTNVVTGGYNTSLNYSLISNLTGEYNVALGYGNLNVSTSSNTNIAIGRDNLFSFTSGTNNIAISGYAGLYNLVTGSNNIAIGYLSLAYVTSASSNTVIGNSSLNNNPFTGDNNTVIGDSNLSSVTTGSNNTVIGRNIQSWTSSLSNNILIGDGSGNIRIMSDSTGNIGIGLTGPSYPLHVSGTVSSDGYNIGATAGFTGTGTYTNFTIIGGIIVSAS